MATFDNIKGLLKRIPSVFGANAPAEYITNDTNFQLPEDNASASTNNAASWNKGFPEVTFQPVPTTEHPEYTGIPPSGGDINALGNALSRPLYTSQFGITPNFYRDDISAIGYPKNAIVWYVGSGTNESVGQVQIRSKVDNNTQAPFVNGVLQSQWEYTNPIKTFSTGAFATSSWATYTFEIPFDITDNNGLPLPDIIISIYANLVGGWFDSSQAISYKGIWQTIYNSSNFQDDANRRRQNGFGIGIVGKNQIRFDTLNSYNFYGFPGASKSWDDSVLVLITLQRTRF